ncbi:PQQ-dependent sugar dehydrogenase [Algoriphagus namhaensis]
MTKNYLVKRALAVIFFGGLLSFSFSCQNPEKTIGSDISTAQDQILKGKELFSTQCSTCHNFKENGIGPNLSGLTRQLPSDWIRGFIQSPAAYFEKEDPRALALLAEYKAPMPAFAELTEEDLNALLSYMHTFSTPAGELLAAENTNWIPEGIEDSGIRLAIREVFQLPPSDSLAPLAKMTKMEPIPGTQRLMINDQRVGIYEVVNQKASLFLDLKSQRPDLVSKPGWGTGVGSFAFHPDYLQNGKFYTAHTEPGGTAQADVGYTDSLQVFMQWVLTEWTNENPSTSVFAGNSRELIRVDIPSQAHGMQELAFHPYAKKGEEDFGLLYVGFGDGGTVEKGFANIAQTEGAGLYSAIWRIDPLGNNSSNGQYGIPESNPFAGVEGKAGEVYAFGFRNPNRLFWTDSGDFYATDIGQHTIEEINRVEPGQFYGWPIREGTFAINPYGSFRQLFPLPENDEQFGVTYPLIQLEHDELAAIYAGYQMPYGPLQGKVIFGDILSGRLFFADLKEEKPRVKSFELLLNGQELTLAELVGKGNRVDLKFGRDAKDHIYIMSKTEGKVYEIIKQ